MKFNNEFIAATLTEAADIAATRISQNFALTAIAEKGSCTLEEAQNMYELAHRVLTEGSEDLIPENLEIPDATDSEDPTAAQDAGVDADVSGAEDGGDLDLSDLEGIVLPDSEGNQYIIQGGILVPYEEEADDAAGMAIGGGDAADDTTGGDDTTGATGDEELDESTGVDAGTTDATQVIEEATSVFANNSSIVKNLLQNTSFAK